MVWGYSMHRRDVQVARAYPAVQKKNTLADKYQSYCELAGIGLLLVISALDSPELNSVVLI
jgi:hypothetical protein